MSRHSSRRAQGGMALLIAFLVLVVVSILGATSMRSALFQGKVSVNQQASQITFQGAESGIEAVLERATAQIEGGVPPQAPAHMFYQAVIVGVPQRVCYNAAGAISVDTNATRTAAGENDINIDFDDCPQRGDNPLLVTSVVTIPPPALNQSKPVEGTSLCGNSGSCFGTTQIYSRSFASISGRGLERSHVQMWGILSPSAGGN